MKNKKEIKSKNHEDVPQVPSEQLFKVTFSRIFKGVHASPGKTWLLVKCKDKTRSYEKGFQILYNTPQEHINDMAQKLYEQIKKQFSL